jgi:hypothetical protein
MEQPVERVLGLGINEDPRDIYRAEQVWDLHLAFADAAVSDPELYSASAKDWDEVRELAEHREAELALETVLAHATPALSPPLLGHAQRVAQLICGDEPAGEVVAWVDGWLRWHPGCGFDPPYWN